MKPQTKPLTDLPALVTAEQAAEALGVSPSTLGVWRTTGRYNLAYVKVGSRVRYRRDDLLAFIERRTHNQPTAAA